MATRDGDLMTLRANTLFTYDERGRMRFTNEPCEIARRPAPRLFLARTASGFVVRFGASVPDEIVLHFTAAVAAEAAGDDLRIPASLLAEARLALEQQAPVADAEAGPAYRFPDGAPSRGDVVRLTEANRALARATFPWLEREVADWQPTFVKVRDGAAVAVCFSARFGPHVAEAGVETLPAYRGHGYAVEVVAAWSDAVRDAGRIPLYSTAWDNAASQGVARRLGLVMFGSDATLA